MHYTFATGNKNKLAEFKAILSGGSEDAIEIESIALDLHEIQSLDPLEVIQHKAKEGFEKAGKPVIVEDTCFVIDSLGGLPGPFIKWFESAVGNEGLIRMTDPENRAATASVYVALYDGTDYIIGKGEVRGTIAHTERGTSGFGWDAIFIPEGSEKTFGEMTQEEKNNISHRRLALLDFKEKVSR